jgi:hypothetical protein
MNGKLSFKPYSVYIYIYIYIVYKQMESEAASVYMPFEEGKNGKAVPVTGHGGPQNCKMSRLSHFLRHMSHRWQ